MTSISRNTMPSKKKIDKYWRPKLVEMGKLYEDDEEYCCFACSLPHPVQRAHILPLNNGGDNSLDNLHLLCIICHEHSEFLSGDRYWTWFNSVDTDVARQQNSEKIATQIKLEWQSFLKKKNLTPENMTDELYDELIKYMELK